MKKITLLLIALIISTLGFSQNLLLDGNFENIDPGNGGQATGLLPTTGAIWTTSMTAAARPSINLNASVAHAGEYFMNVPNDFQSFRQSFTAVTNTEYTVTLWNQFIMPGGQITDPDDGIFISIRQDSGNNGTQFDPIISFYIDPSTADANWTEYTFNFTAPQTNLLFYVSKQSRTADGDGGLNNACRMDDFSIVATPTASLEDLQKFNFSAYPNPAKDYINLSASNNIDKIEIYNMVGQQVEIINLNSSNKQVDVSKLSKGIYLLKAYIEDAVGSYKFVKQ